MKGNNASLGIILIIFSVLLIAIVSSLKVDMDEQGAYLCELVDLDPTLNMEECPAHKNNSSSWLVMIAFSIALLILAVGIYLSFFHKKNKNNKINISKLDDEEKKIIKIVEENGGSAYQSDIVKELELSKVQVTRVLDKLENKNILERKRRGMANLIVLK